MKTLSPPAKSSRPGGQTLALLAFVLPVLIGAMGLATDVANFYFNYVRVQTGADASVLSGVKYLPDQPGAAISTATTYATSFNSIAAAEIVSTTTSYDASLCPAPGSPPPPPVPGCELTMTIQRIVPYYFARLVGVNSGTMSVTASATAGVPAASVNYGVVPIGVQVGTPFPYSDGAVAALPFLPNPRPPVAVGTWSSLALGGIAFTSNVPGGYPAKVSIQRTRGARQIRRCGNRERRDYQADRCRSGGGLDWYLFGAYGQRHAGFDGCLGELERPERVLQR